MVEPVLAFATSFIKVLVKIMHRIAIQKTAVYGHSYNSQVFGASQVL
jgi:hypothetical protein